MPVIFSRIIRTALSSDCCIFSYSGMPFLETDITVTIIMGAIIHRIEAKTGSMVNVIMIPPSSIMGARMPMD